MSDSRTFSAWYVYWCEECGIQTERSWHIYKRGPALIQQLDEEHDCKRIEVVPAAELASLKDALRDAATVIERMANGASRKGCGPEFDRFHAAVSWEKT